MDTAVANLLKHKINFRLTHEENHYGRKELRYMSMLIENKLNIGARHTYGLYVNSVCPFIVHFISTFVTKESERINYISVSVELWNLWEGEDIYRETLMTMFLDNPKVGIQQFPSNTDPRVYSVLESAINEPFKIEVSFSISMPHIIRDMRRPSDDRIFPEDISGGDFDEEEEEQYTPPIETHKED